MSSKWSTALRTFTSDIPMLLGFEIDGMLLRDALMNGEAICLGDAKSSIHRISRFSALILGYCKRRGIANVSHIEVAQIAPDCLKGLNFLLSSLF